ncbi:hypothetical protein [Vibrio toranzoniae]|uniref:hypothetical protein n=1 Tax=Vibrio toranzoniae TaxID=1194427 RepID=UPI001378F011|nr:hypothetical protein [Vibrio toranzoniae]NAZ69887.1 hypothetical protein [Vibrio toranzoniae]
MSFLDSIPVVGSYRKSSKAEDIVFSAKRQHRRANRRLEDSQKEAQNLVDQLFELKVECATNSIDSALNVLEKCQKINKSETKVVRDTIGTFNSKSLPALRAQSTSIADIASEGAKGTAAGAALSLGSMGAVSSLGAASTGTAISTLSGAAASNATLAWFGGGAISAGGAGVAGGAMVLGGIALAPLAVIGAFKYASHAEKKLTEAYDFRNQVEEAIEQIDAAIDISDGMNQHVNLFTDTLSSLRARLICVSDLLSFQLAETPNDVLAIDKTKKQLILFIKAVKRLLEVTLFDKNQNPTEESIRIIHHANYTDEDSVQTLIHDVDDKRDRVSPNVRYLSEIEPGQDSPLFFWLLDVIPEFKPSKSTKSKKQNKKTKNELNFKEALSLWAVSFIGVFASFFFESTLFLLFSVFFVINTPIIWFSGKLDEDSTLYSILGLIMLATGGLLTCIYIWG